MSTLTAESLPAIRRAHDAAVELGAKCGPDCMFTKTPTETQSKQHNMLRAKALSFLIAAQRN